MQAHTQKALEFMCLFSTVDIQAAIRSVQQIRSQIRTYGFGRQPKPTAADTWSLPLQFFFLLSLFIWRWRGFYFLSPSVLWVFPQLNAEADGLLIETYLFATSVWFQVCGRVHAFLLLRVRGLDCISDMWLVFIKRFVILNWFERYSRWLTEPGTGPLKLFVLRFRQRKSQQCKSALRMRVYRPRDPSSPLEFGLAGLHG